TSSGCIRRRAWASASRISWTGSTWTSGSGKRPVPPPEPTANDVVPSQTQTHARRARMPRINRAIELLSQDQPVYYNSTHDLTFESGKAAANTWADFINIDMEHHPFDVAGLSKFMEGLV